MGHVVHVVTPLSFAWKFCTFGLKHIGSQVTTCTYGCCKIQFRRREWCKLICIMNHFMIPKMKKIQLRFPEHSWLVQKEMADHLSKKGHKLAKGKALALQWFPNDLYARRWLAHHHRWAIPFHWTSLAEGLRMATFWDGKFHLFRAAWLSHLQII